MIASTYAEEKYIFLCISWFMLCLY